MYVEAPPLNRDRILTLAGIAALVVIALKLDWDVGASWRSWCSTSGALVVANSPDDRRDFVYKKLLQWGMSMIIVAPVTAWAIFVLPGWL
jgi:hypothetical protein